MFGLLSLVALLGVGPALAAEDITPKPYEPEIEGIVGGVLEQLHYSKQQVDDRVSSDWFDLWLRSLDYNRMIFLASDVKEFEALRTQLDDSLHAEEPDLSPATVIYERYRQRMAERMAFAKQVLAEGPDLTNEETWVIDRGEKKLPWPATVEEANKLWTQRVESDLIGALFADCGTKADCYEGQREASIERLTKRYDRIVKNVEGMESVDVLELYLGALARSFDPHSVWFKPATNDNFDIDITNSVEGIGASLQVVDDYTTVQKVIPGGPAEMDARLQKGDRIVAVAQGSEEPVDIVGMRIDHVVKLIRGEKGSKVVLLVRPKDALDPSAVTRIELVRDRVNLESSEASLLVKEIDGHTLGIIHVPSFYLAPQGSEKSVSQDVRRLLNELKAQNAEGVILDLSNNGGGSLRESIEMAGLFISSGPVVQVRDRRGRVSPLFDSDANVVWTKPVVVLTSQASASASEIVAGALQDYGRALVVGAVQTHGKGTVQQIFDVTRMMKGRQREPIGGALKMTIQKFYRISGGSTQLKGVEADVVLPSPYDGMDVLEGDLDHAMPWDSIPMVPYPTAGDLKALVPELQARSTKRVKVNEDFQELEEIKAEREAFREVEEVSLHLETRRLELEKLNLKDGDEEEAEGESEEERKYGYFQEEAAHVLADLLELQD